jgi:molybdate transport system substrate-binding protein
MKKRHLLMFLLGLALALGCQPSRVILPATAQEVTLTVSAAASLKDALQELQTLYQQRASNIRIAYNFGASGALQQQIEQGAPVDIFVSAAAKQMDALQSKNLLLPKTRRNLLTNQLALIAPKNSTGITSFNQLSNPNVKRIVIGEPRSVPAGEYAVEVFKKLGILEQIKSKFVLGNNVRQVLAAVESGSVDAGMVYITDARTSNQVKVVAIAPEKLHSSIVYPIAVLKASKNASAAQAFVQYLSGNEASAVFKNHGFAIAKHPVTN